MNFTIGTLIITSLGLVAFLLLYIVLRRDNLQQRVTRRLRTLETRMNEYNERVRLVESHAADYMNSLGPDGARVVSEIRRTVQAIEDLLQEVGSLLAARDLGALQEAELLLDGGHPSQHTERQNFDGTTSKRFAFNDNWEEQMEDMLQRLGGEVSRASIQAKESGIPKRPKRQSTIFSLFKAGIRTDRSPYDW